MSKSTQTRITHLHPHIIRNLPSLNQPSHKIEISVARRGIRDLDLLHVRLDQHMEEPRLLLDRHRVRQGLVAVPQVRREPDRCRPLDFGWPLSVRDVQWDVRLVLLGGISAVDGVRSGRLSRASLISLQHGHGGGRKERDREVGGCESSEPVLESCLT
jgi:hypothetical protein